MASDGEKVNLFFKFKITILIIYKNIYISIYIYIYKIFNIYLKLAFTLNTFLNFFSSLKF